MNLKYVGPKARISHTGIDFDENKEDKFVYLNIVLQLLSALDHEYLPEKTYTYSPDTSRLSNEEIWSQLTQYCPNLKERYHDAEMRATHYVDEHIIHAKESLTTNDDEKNVLINNLTIMKSYIIQRSVNKNLYYCAVDALAEVIKRGHIDYVIAPMFQKFAHVFHSVEGVLRKGRFPIDTNIEIFEQEGKLLVKLDIIHR
ncbi:MAG: hypothetical protein U9N52_13515 [Campylobacterota bacterium]|nr:hypothetical protein [Campylobacterota bacterium]